MSMVKVRSTASINGRTIAAIKAAANASVAGALLQGAPTFHATLASGLAETDPGESFLYYTDEVVYLYENVDDAAVYRATIFDDSGAGGGGAGSFFETVAEAAAEDLSDVDSTIRTNGYASGGDGGAAAYLRTTSLVNGGFQDQSSEYWKPSLDNPIAPETFGAIGGDSDNDDSQAFQDMFDAIMENSKNGVGYASLRPGQRYWLADDADLTVDPGYIGVYGNGARMTFKKSSTDPSLETELLTDNSFESSGTGWTGFSAISGSYNDYDFDGSNAYYSGTDADDGVYAGIYQQVSLISGRWYRMVTNYSYITFASAGQQYVRVGVRGGGPDSGSDFTQAYGSSQVGEEQSYDFKWTGDTGTFWFQVKSNNPVTVNDVSLKILPQNFCLQLDGDYSPFATQYSPALGALSWNNLVIDALGGSSNWGIGVFANTDTSTYRTQYGFRDVVINDFYNGLQTANRAYICSWDGGGTRGCKNANVLFGEGSDAGENMRLSNLTISNTDTGVPGVVNKGRLVHMQGCSVDYIGGSFLRLEGGYIHADMCHFEKSGPAAENYPFDVQSGTLLLNGGYCQLNTTSPTTMDYVFNIGSGGRVVIDNMQAYGWQTSTSAIATGEGHIKSRLSGIGQKTNSGFLMRSEKTSLVRLSNTHTDDFGTLFENWKYCVHGGTRVTSKETSYLLAEPLTVDVRTTGQGGVSITKLDGYGQSAVFYLAIPVPRDGMVSQEFYIKVPANASASGTGDIFIDWYQADLIGDENGTFALPSDDEGRWWGGEFNVARDIDWAAGQDWTAVDRNGAQNTNSETEGEEFGADWRSHWVLQLNLVNLPVGSEVQVCDLLAEVT